MSDFVYQITGRIKPAVKDGVATIDFTPPVPPGQREGIKDQAPAMVLVKIRGDLDEIPTRVHNRHGAKRQPGADGRNIVAEAKSGKAYFTVGRRVFKEEGDAAFQLVDAIEIDKKGLQVSFDTACFLLFRYPTLLEATETSLSRGSRRLSPGRKRSSTASRIQAAPRCASTAWRGCLNSPGTRSRPASSSKSSARKSNWPCLIWPTHRR